MISTKDAAKNLLDFHEICKDIGIGFYLDGGTLLGAYRDKDFCEDDQDDIDLTAFYDQWPLVDELERRALAAGFELYHKWDDKAYPVPATPQISFKRNDGKIDLMFKKKKGDWLWWTVFRGQTRVVYKKLPLKYISEFKVVNFKDDTFLVPGMINEYLTYRYGDWTQKVHRSQYSCYTTDLSIVNSFDEI